MELFIFFQTLPIVKLTARVTTMAVNWHVCPGEILSKTILRCKYKSGTHWHEFAGLRTCHSDANQSSFFARSELKLVHC